MPQTATRSRAMPRLSVNDPEHDLEILRQLYPGWNPYGTTSDNDDEELEALDEGAEVSNRPPSELVTNPMGYRQATTAAQQVAQRPPPKQLDDLVMRLPFGAKPPMPENIPNWDGTPPKIQLLSQLPPTTDEVPPIVDNWGTTKKPSKGDLNPGMFRDIAADKKPVATPRTTAPNDTIVHAEYGSPADFNWDAPIIGGPLGVPDTTATQAPAPTRTATPPKGAPVEPATIPPPPQLPMGTIAPTTNLSMGRNDADIWRGVNMRGATEPLLPPDGTAPTTGPAAIGQLQAPPPPATRLQPPKPIDRASLYKQLRPYPGMSQSEKMSRLLADVFRNASQPGTGSAFKDSARGFAGGLDSYNKLRDYDRGVQSDYAGKVLEQVSKGEEYLRQYYDTLSEIDKRGAEGQRALAYARYLDSRGAYYEQRGKNEAYEGVTRRGIAEATRDRPIILDEGQQAFRPGNPVPFAKVPAPPATPTVAQSKFDFAIDAVNHVRRLAPGGQLPPLVEAQLFARFAGIDDTDTRVGSPFVMAYQWASMPPGPEKDAEEARLRAAGELADKVTPRPDPRPTAAEVAEVKKGPIKNIVDFNMWKFTDPKTGVVDWEGAKTAARLNQFERDIAGEPAQTNVRNQQLVEMIEDMRRQSTDARNRDNSYQRNRERTKGGGKKGGDTKRGEPKGGSFNQNDAAKRLADKLTEAQQGR